MSSIRQYIFLTFFIVISLIFLLFSYHLSHIFKSFYGHFCSCNSIDNNCLLNRKILFVKLFFTRKPLQKSLNSLSCFLNLSSFHQIASFAHNFAKLN